MDRRSFLGVVSLTALAMAGIRPAAGDEAPVLSFVHPSGRIDVAREDILSIEAYDHIEIYVPETRERTTYPDFGVTICFSRRVREKLKTMTTRIVDQEIDVITGCEVIVSPVIREPLGDDPCFSITTFDRDETIELATRLQDATGVDCNTVS